MFIYCNHYNQIFYYNASMDLIGTRRTSLIAERSLG